MKPGSVLYTGHVVTNAEAQAYREQQRRCDRYLEGNKLALVSGTLANRKYNFMLDCKHKLIVSIAKT